MFFQRFLPRSVWSLWSVDPCFVCQREASDLVPVCWAKLYSAESVLLLEADAVVQVVVMTRVASRHGARFQVGRVARASMAEKI